MYVQQETNFLIPSKTKYKAWIRDQSKNFLLTRSLNIPTLDFLSDLFFLLFVTFVYLWVVNIFKAFTNHILHHISGHLLSYLLSFPSIWSFIISKALFNLSWHNDSHCLVPHGSERCSFRGRWGIHNLPKRAKPHLAFAWCSFYKRVVGFPFPQSQHCAFVCRSNL